MEEGFMATYQYKTKGTCSQVIQFTLEGGKLSDVAFLGGCNGNLKGISRLVDGQDPTWVADTLEGTLCGNKKTSCPDQFAKAIKAAELVESGKEQQVDGLVKVD